jgi:hypothetical protein
LNVFFLHASDNLCELGGFPSGAKRYPAGLRNRPVIPTLLKARHAAATGCISAAALLFPRGPCTDCVSPPSPAKEPPTGPDWIHEIKHDGFRIIARRDKDGVRLFTRKNRRVTFVYYEHPDLRRIKLDKLARHIAYGARKRLFRHGLVRDQAFAEKLLGYWSRF